MIDPLFTFIKNDKIYVYFRSGEVKPVETGLINSFTLSHQDTYLTCKVSAINDSFNIRFVGTEAVTFLHFGLHDFRSFFSYPHALFPIEIVHKVNNIISLSSAFSLHMVREIKNNFKNEQTRD